MQHCTRPRVAFCEASRERSEPGSAPLKERVPAGKAPGADAYQWHVSLPETQPARFRPTKTRVLAAEAREADAYWST